MTRIYVTLLTLAAVLVTVALTISSPLAVQTEEILAFTIFVATTAVAHQYAFRVDDGKISYSLAFILILTAILIFPPVIAVYCAVTGVAVFELSRKASAASVAWFNTAQ